MLSPNTPQRTYYPNPGYLGPTSHVAIFNHIFSDQDPTRETGETGETDSPLPSACLSMDDYPSAKLGAELTRQLLGSFDLKALEDLVIFWCAKGANLAVAEPVVKLCSQSCNFLSLSTLQGEDWHMNLTSRLLQNTARPLEYGHESTISNYSSQFLGANTRWETFGIFLSAAIRATMDILFFPSLYTTPSRNRELRGLLMRLIDCSLDICLSMDCLNDLQLILQYENFIIHSHVDGDHSKLTVSVLESMLTTKAIATGETWETSSPLHLHSDTMRTLNPNQEHRDSLWNFEKLFSQELTQRTRMSRSFSVVLCE